MILVDTSVWVDHLRFGSAKLAAELEAGNVLTHPFVIGEIACGNLKKRREVLRLLAELPSAPAATNAEAMTLLERHELMGRGIGLVDVHLLASAALAAPATLWTHDRRLAKAAGEMGMADEGPR